MKNLYKYMLILTIVICFVVLPMIGCFSYSPQDTENALNQDRPQEALQLPDFSGNITDVRITVKERTFDGGGVKSFDDLKMLQVYYGYLSDGEWHDLPCENYNLVGIFNVTNEAGWKAAQQSHMVKIGSYLLFSFYEKFRTEVVWDTLETEAIEPFTDYYTGYGYLIEDREGIISGNLDYKGISKFYPRRYILLRYDSLPDDYELHYKTSSREYILTKQQIDQALNGLS